MENQVTALFLAGCAFMAWANKSRLAASFVPLSSPVDWCEENYEVSDHIVEFWNSISSFAMCVVAFVAPRYFDPNMDKHEPNSWMLWFLICVVGIGSVYFHGSLSIAGQVLDELPISLLATWGGFMLRPVKKWNPTVRAIAFSPKFLMCTTVGSTLISILYPVLSHVLVLSMVPLTLYGFFQEFGDSSEKAKMAARPMFSITLTLFAISAGCWVTDKLGCEYIVPTLGFNPQLHAWWHVFVSLTFWSCVCTGIIIRSYGDGVQVSVKPSGMMGAVPYIAMVV